VTHGASLARVDGASFGAEDAEGALDAIGGFLGLVSGRWATPLVAVGLDEQGNTVWQDWRVRLTSPWRGTMNAFDRHHAEYLEPAFRGYLERWEDPLWNEPLRIATQMYVEANGPVMADSSLFLAQATLELIAWVRFVEELQTHDENSFDQSRALPAGCASYLTG
jgi:hypothetical protein